MEFILVATESKSSDSIHIKFILQFSRDYLLQSSEWKRHLSIIIWFLLTSNWTRKLVLYICCSIYRSILLVPVKIYKLAISSTDTSKTHFFPPNKTNLPTKFPIIIQLWFVTHFTIIRFNSSVSNYIGDLLKSNNYSNSSFLFCK